MKFPRITAGSLERQAAREAGQRRNEMFDRVGMDGWMASFDSNVRTFIPQWHRGELTGPEPEFLLKMALQRVPELRKVPR